MRSIQIHPPLSFPHKPTTGHQPLSKTRRGRNIMHTPSGPPVAAPGSLVARQAELRQAAIVAVRERLAARQRAKQVASQAKRAAGEADMTKLTVELIKEELRLRRDRGETVSRLPTNREQALEMLAEARRTVPETSQSRRRGETGPLPHASRRQKNK